MFRGTALRPIDNKQTIHNSQIAYQVFFAIVLFYVTFFISSQLSANERNIQRTNEALLEEMLERRAERSLELLQQLQEVQVANHTEQRIEENITRSAQRQVEEQIDAQQFSAIEDVHLVPTTDRIRFMTHRIRTLAQELQTERTLNDLPGTREIARITEESEPLPEDIPGEELPDDDILGGGFDSGAGDEPTEKGNDEVEEETTEEAEEQISEEVTSDIDDSFAEASFDVSDLQFEQALTAVQNDARILENIDEKAVWTNQWVIMADASAKDVLEKEGYEFSNEEHLEAFDSIIANVKAPASYDLFEDYQLVMQKLDKHDAVLDLNHVYTNIYTNATQTEVSHSGGMVPGDLMTIDGKGVKIGMVDTAIDENHKFLQKANIVQQHFTQDNRDPVYEHGTAVASVFSGSSENFHGVIKDAQLYNASVFIEADESESITTALSLMKGLNWLVQQDIKVINMSLAGPPNRLLQKGIQQLCQQGIIIVAAAGNDGPLAKPMYPAGYGCAVAVTAVDAKNKLYKKAVRGNHIDVAAYGVDILAASKNHAVTVQSGTSIAAPFVSAWIAAQLPDNGLGNNWLEMALENCIDLGAKGTDPLYGKGLLPFNTLQLAKLHQFSQLEMLLHR